MSISSTGSSLSTGLSSVASSPSGISSPGIGSGLNVNSIVSALMGVEQQTVVHLQQQQSSYQTKLSAYGSLSGALSTFQIALGGLTNLSTFQALSATSSNAAVLSASASTQATPGNYSVTVNNTAQAQTISTTGQTSLSTAIGSGAATTLSFSFGTTSGTVTNGVYQTGTTFTQDPAQPTKTVTIDSTNNSLQGIANSINSANIGVTASIVNDGSATPYHLMLTSSTGASSSMQISASGDASITSLLNYNPTQAAGSGQNMTQTVAPLSASLNVNGLAITSASNSLTSAIPGVTLNLAQAGTTSLSVSNNNASAITSSVQSFVTAYNSLNSSLNNLTSYDPTTSKGSALTGDPVTTMVQAQIRGVLSSSISGLGSSSLTSLGQLGISFNIDGSMTLNNITLQNAVSSNPTGIGALFASMGTTTDSLVNYVSSTSSSQPGSYAVNVSHLATQGNAVGSVNLNGGATITQGSNDTLNLTLDGVSSSVTLAAGTYTATQLATLVQSAINGNTTFSGLGSSASVSVNPASGFMTIQSNRYSSASNVTVTNSGAGATLFGTGTSTAGTDVAGTINGIAAIGSGQELTGASGTPTDGIKIQIGGGALGARGTVSFSNGYAVNMNTALNTILGSSGMINSQTAGINKSIQSISDQITAENSRLAQVQQTYMAQFTSLDTLMAQMQNTSNYLTQQITGMSYTQKNYG